ncbi:endocuticle structural glycoprotein SgAbd-8-like [Aricia agestis]|uniref:endocuticle structural glycoprotein SgAbd-8-like n=1 Tax=Aricia agestis TaxID=91739 RepID=UPI001C2070E6|nr:endocuticle structural glycoprotein SgAbd-8-like [Aricia agestis]
MGGGFRICLRANPHTVLRAQLLPHAPEIEVTFELASLSGAWCRSGGGGGIIRNDFEGPHPDGSYRWALQTDEGIFHEQRGSFPPNAEHEPSLVVEGQYQYTAPDGQVINVLYTADEYGFHPTGAHLPTPPPIPPAIQRSLDYIARVNQNQL